MGKGYLSGCVPRTLISTKETKPSSAGLSNLPSLWWCVIGNLISIPKIIQINKITKPNYLSGSSSPIKTEKTQ